MRGLVSRWPSSTRFSQAGAVVRSKSNRAVLGGLGQAIGDLAGGALDAAGTALKDVGNIVDGLAGLPSALRPAIPTRGGNGAPSASGGATWTRPGPSRPTYTPPASGGDETPGPTLPAHPQDPSAPSAAPSAPTPLSRGASADAASAAPATSPRPTSAPHVLMQSALTSGADDSRTGDVTPLSPSNTASSTDSLSPTGALAGGASGHGKAFPQAAAAALGCVLGLLILCAVVWLYRSKRRRRAARAHPDPKRAMSLVSATTVSTVPLFISAREAGVADQNPFRHPRDADEDDPFDARASWWSASTTRSASTISV